MQKTMEQLMCGYKEHLLVSPSDISEFALIAVMVLPAFQKTGKKSVIFGPHLNATNA